MKCRICGNEPPEELVHLPIYVSGSEGVDLCYACRMMVTDFVRAHINACARARMAVRLLHREEFRKEEP